MGITERITRASLTRLSSDERARVLADFAPTPDPTLRLVIHIDQDQRRADLAALTDSDFFTDLQSNAAGMRAEFKTGRTS